MKGRKTNKKAERLLAKNLTYLRLQGDLYAVEAELAELKSTESGAQGQTDIFQRFFSLIKEELKNGLIRQNAEELERDKQRATQAIETFETTYGKKAYALAKNPEKLKKFIEKTYKKDDGLGRVRFALAFASDATGEYVRPSESMQVVSEALFDDPARMATLCSALRANFNAIREKSIVDIQTGWIKDLGALSVLMLSDIAMSVTGVLSLMQFVKNKKKIDKAFKEITPDELSALLALKLTSLEAVKGTIAETQWKEAVDDLLRHIDGIRADAEYGWLVENEEGQENKEHIALCDRCIHRLAQILR